EDREVVAVRVELQEEAVVADLAQRLQMPGQLLEVQTLSRAVGHLDGVAAAKARRLRALFAVQPLEPAALAARTIDLAPERRNLDPALKVLPDIEIDQFAVDLVEPAGEDLDRLRRLEAGDDVDDGRQDAGGFASAAFARRRGRLEDAAQARRLTRQDRHRLAVAANAAAVDPRLIQFHSGVVNQVADLEIIGAVENQIGVVDQLGNIRPVDVGDDRLDVDGGIDR